MSKIYELTVIPGATDVKGDEVLEALENGADINGKIVLEYNAKTNLIMTHLVEEDETPSRKTHMGVINEVEEQDADGNLTESSVEEIQNLIVNGYDCDIIGAGDDYEIKLKFVPNEIIKITARVNLEGIKQQIVDAGIWTQEELDERMEAFEKWQIEDYIVEQLLLSAKKFDVIERKPDTLFENYAGIMNKILLGVALRIPVYARGNKGTGKNTAFRSAAWVAGLPFGEISPNKNSDNETLFGGKTTLPPEISKIPQDMQRKMANAYMRFMKGDNSLSKKEIELADDWERIKAGAPAVQIISEESQIVSVTKNGGALHLNEFDRLDANSASFFNPYGDGSRFIDIPYHGRMEISEDCQIFASCNPGYAGGQKSNDATADRFLFVNFPNPNAEQIENIFQAAAYDVYEMYKDAKGKCIYITKGAEAYVKMLQSVTDRKVSNDKCLSIRSFINAFNIVALSRGKMTLKEAVNLTVLEHCDEVDKLALCRIVEDIGI